MGLDASILYCSNRPAARAAEKQFKRAFDKTVTEIIGAPQYKNNGSVFREIVDQFTEENWKQIVEKLTPLAEQLNLHTSKNTYWLTDYGMVPAAEHKDVRWLSKPSTCYPDHYYKIGYMRVDCYGSNPLGRVLDRIFHPRGSEFRPSWKNALERVGTEITKTKDEWTRQALEIVRESIQHVLNSGEPQNYYILWSA